MARTLVGGRFEGLSGIEWSNPENCHDEAWLVVLGNTPDSTPRVLKLGASGAWAEVEKAPFQSLVVERFRQAQRFQTTRIAKAVLWTLGFAVMAAFTLSFLVGLLQLRVVVSDSMAGTFERGDVLAVVSPRIVPAELDSIVVFHYYNVDRTELVGDFSHRIVGGSATEGWVTQGDANPEPDQSLVFRQDIVGTVVGWVPNVGFAFQPNVLLGVMVLVLVAVVIGPDLGALLKRGKK